LRLFVCLFFAEALRLKYCCGARWREKIYRWLARKHNNAPYITYLADANARR
jgi:hypothetical protein